MVSFIPKSLTALFRLYSANLSSFQLSSSLASVEGPGVRIELKPKDQEAECLDGAGNDCLKWQELNYQHETNPSAANPSDRRDTRAVVGFRPEKRKGNSKPCVLFKAKR